MAPSDQPNASYYSVTPGFFPAMGIRLVKGRLFTAQDDARAPRVAIVNEAFVRQHFPHTEVLGHRIYITNVDRGPSSWREIVGVVADITQSGLDQVTPAQTYEPFAQQPDNSLNIVIRTTGPTAPLLSSLRPTVYAVDQDQPIRGIQPLEEIMAASLSRQRFAMLLLAIFSLVALVIAAVGIYGVMAYNVTQRTGEIGIRMALGAQPRDVLGLMFRHGARLVGLGLVLGLAASLATARVLASLLFHTSTRDPLTLAAITLLLGAVGALACLLPARRATKVDPMTALRAE